MKYILPIVVWMVGIFVSSSLPQTFFPEVGSWIWGKLIHVLYFGVLALLFQGALRNQTRWHIPLRYLQIASILIAIVYGATDEIHQLSTPGRHGQVTDVFIDGFGATLFILASMAYRKMALKKVNSRYQITDSRGRE